MPGPSSGRHRRATSALSGKLALKFGLCLCAGQLIAGPILATAAEAAPITAAEAKVPAKVTESVSTRSLAAGSAVRLTAKVINPTTGKVATSGSVRIQVLSGKAWKLARGRLNLGKSGQVTFTSKPSNTTTFRMAYSGAGGLGASTSNAIQVKVTRPGDAQVLAEAKRHTGALYLFGAAGPARFDCSGFTMYVYKKAVGRSLPHQANAQQRYGRAISKKSMQPGDLIIFRSGSYGYHAGIYAGGDYMYDSPHSGARVGKHKIYSGNYVVRRLA